MIKNYGTGGVLLTAAQSLNEVVLIRDEEGGEVPVGESLRTNIIKQMNRFRMGWLIWSEMGQGVACPDNPCFQALLEKYGNDQGN